MKEKNTFHTIISVEKKQIGNVWIVHILIENLIQIFLSIVYRYVYHEEKVCSKWVKLFYNLFQMSKIILWNMVQLQIIIFILRN